MESNGEIFAQIAIGAFCAVFIFCLIVWVLKRWVGVKVTCYRRFIQRFSIGGSHVATTVSEIPLDVFDVDVEEPTLAAQVEGSIRKSKSLGSGVRLQNARRKAARWSVAPYTRRGGGIDRHPVCRLLKPLPGGPPPLPVSLARHLFQTRGTLANASTPLHTMTLRTLCKKRKKCYASPSFSEAIITSSLTTSTSFDVWRTSPAAAPSDTSETESEDEQVEFDLDQVSNFTLLSTPRFQHSPSSTL